MNFDDLQKETLKKLGEAIYLHREHIKMAEKARDAVDYMVEQGVFEKKDEQLIKRYTVGNMARNVLDAAENNGVTFRP